MKELVSLFSSPAEAQQKISIAINNGKKDITADVISEMLSESENPKAGAKDVFWGSTGNKVLRYIEGDTKNTSDFFKNWSQKLRAHKK